MAGVKKQQTPAEQFRISIVFNVLSATAAISMATALLVYHAGMDDVTPLIWSAISLFYVIGVWQIVSLVNNLKLRRIFIRKEKFESENKGAETASLEGKTVPDLVLPEAHPERFEPASVTESTTRKLGQKAKRRD